MELARTPRLPHSQFLAMTILTDADLDFARAHIERFYDSDFFPKSPTFAAFWHQWNEVKTELQSKNLAKHPVAPPRSMTVAKPKGGFRVVHQLDPVEAIMYSALASAIAPSIEEARAPIDSHIACSYRFDLKDGSFFASGSGWAKFSERTEALAKTHSHVLLTDITDFYNQIYLHRLNNAIESADPLLKSVAWDIEQFLSTLNIKASKGLPVGPAASIVMAEAVLIDVDEFLRDQGVAHTRYVDDFRIFSDSARVLSKVLERLTLYLYENHRLTVSTEKSSILLAENLLAQQLHSPFAEEKVQILETLKVHNPYTNQIEDLGFENLDERAKMESELLDALIRTAELKPIDLGLARMVLRTARRNKVLSIAEPLLDRFEIFVPAANDVALYFDEVLDPTRSKEFRTRFEALLEHPGLDNQLSRFWTEWMLSRNETLMQSPSIRAYLLSGANTENQAAAAITTRNIAWVRDHKARIHDMGARARRAVLHASQVLPSDERKPWLKSVISNTTLVSDRWVAQWVLDSF